MAISGHLYGINKVVQNVSKTRKDIQKGRSLLFKKPSRNRNDVGTQLWKSLLCCSNKMPKRKCNVNKEVYLNHDSGSWNVQMASFQPSWKGPLAASQGITMCLRSQNRARHVQKKPNTQGGLGLKQAILVGSSPVLSNLTVSVPSKVASSVT